MRAFEEDQMTKQKGPDSVRARGIAKEKIVPVANGSQQPRAPGWVAPGSANVQSANIEQQGAALRSRGSLQGGSAGDLTWAASAAAPAPSSPAGARARPPSACRPGAKKTA
jgi:hypothetical protein